MFCLNGIYSIKYIKLVVDKLVFGAYNRQSVVSICLSTICSMNWRQLC